MKQYAYSYDREDYTGSFDSPEEAVAEAVRKSEGLSSPPTEIFVGVLVEADPQTTDHAERIVEAMNRRAHVDYGDAAARYLKNASKQQIAELDQEIARTIAAWLERNKMRPTFVKVQGIREYPIPSLGFTRSKPAEGGEVNEIGMSDVSAEG
jgi:hypothetical protein